ncbi:hypothetical protein Hanom_Chr16g01464461 [Helianthus anomalus]
MKTHVNSHTHFIKTQKPSKPRWIFTLFNKSSKTHKIFYPDIDHKLHKKSHLMSSAQHHQNGTQPPSDLPSTITHLCPTPPKTPTATNLNATTTNIIAHLYPTLPLTPVSTDHQHLRFQW